MTPVGDEFQVNTVTESNQAFPAVATSYSGDYVVVWESPDDGNSPGIFARHYDASGQPIDDQFQVNTIEGDQTNPDISMSNDGNGNGEYVVVWQSIEGETTKIYSRRFNSDDSPIDQEEVWVNEYMEYGVNPAVALEPAGSFAVTWDDQNDIYVRHFDVAWDMYGEPFVCNLHTDGTQYLPDVAIDGGGNFTVVWVNEGTYPGVQDKGDIIGLMFNSSAEPVTEEFLVNQAGPSGHSVTDDTRPSIAMTPEGNFVVAWHAFWIDQFGTGQPYADEDGIVARQFGNNGTPLDDDFVVNTNFEGTQDYPSASMAINGDFVVCWSSADDQDGSFSGVFGQAFYSDGSPNGEEFQVNTYTEGNQAFPAVAMDGNGNFVVVWMSEEQDEDANGIFGQMFETS